MVNVPGLAGTPVADRCLVMGVVNVTPDSFSDGGRWYGAGLAIEHGLEMVARGADIVDVGGESTRPGAQRVDADEELRRVKPVITELVRAGAVVSVDTMRAPVAEWALEAEAFLVWPTFEVKRYARRVGRRLGLHKVRRRYRARVADRRSARSTGNVARG